MELDVVRLLEFVVDSTNRIASLTDVMYGFGCWNHTANLREEGKEPPCTE